MLIWAAMQDVGGMNAVMPVVRELQSAGHKVHILAKGKSAELLPNILRPREMFTFISFSGDEFLKDVAEVAGLMSRPDALITSLCSDIGRNLIPFLKNWVATFAIQDFWGARLQGEWADEKYHPDFMCVMDRIDGAIVKKAWPDFSDDRIVITGNPAFDAVAQHNVASGQKQFQEILKLINNWPVVLYCVDYLGGSAEGLHDLVSALNDVGEPVYFIPRFHPDFKNRAVKGEPEECERALARFNTGIIVRDTLSLDLLSILSASTVVISTWGTVLTTAAHMKKQVISVMFPHLGQAQFNELVSRELGFKYPLVELGAAACATNLRELADALKRSFNNQLNLQETQARVFQADGRSAQRVARLVMGKC